MKDEDLIIFNKGIKEGQLHSEPSYKTQKFMEETSNKITSLSEQMKSVNKEVGEIKEHLTSFENKVFDKLGSLRDAINCLDDKFVKKDDYKEDMTIISKTLEKLKSFRWQITAGAAVFLWLFEKFGDKLIK
jgi:uncharacterized coiled-coil DUF342 family protein